MLLITGKVFRNDCRTWQAFRKLLYFPSICANCYISQVSVPLTLQQGLGFKSPSYPKILILDFQLLQRQRLDTVLSSVLFCTWLLSIACGKKRKKKKGSCCFVFYGTEFVRISWAMHQGGHLDVDNVSLQQRTRCVRNWRALSTVQDLGIRRDLVSLFTKHRKARTVISQKEQTMKSKCNPVPGPSWGTKALFLLRGREGSGSIISSPK